MTFVERLAAQGMELSAVTCLPVRPASPQSRSLVLLTTCVDIDTDAGSRYLERAKLLNNAGFRTEIYALRRKLGAQLHYAAKHGMVAVIEMPLDVEASRLTVRNLPTGDQMTVSVADGPDQMLAVINLYIERNKKEEDEETARREEDRRREERLADSSY